MKFERLVQWAKDWKALGAAVAMLFAGWLWLDARLDQVQAAIEIVPVVREMEHAFERQTVAFNLLRCELKDTPPIDCDPYEGLDASGFVPTHPPLDR